MENESTIPKTPPPNHSNDKRIMAKLLKILSTCFVGFAGYMVMSHDLRGAMLPDERGALWGFMILFDTCILAGFLSLSWYFINRKYKIH